MRHNIHHVSCIFCSLTEEKADTLNKMIYFIEYNYMLVCSNCIEVLHRFCSNIMRNDLLDSNLPLLEVVEGHGYNGDNAD